MIKVFISYSHIDRHFRDQLQAHLSALKRNRYIDVWTDQQILPGGKWAGDISDALNKAQIILLLLSSDFLASDYCNLIEMQVALDRDSRGEAVVIPVILRFCDWKNTPVGLLNALPLEGKPINDWDNVDKAYLNIVEGIKNAIWKLSGKGKEGQKLISISHESTM